MNFLSSSKPPKFILSTWNIASLTDLNGVFGGLGYNAKTMSINGLGTWDVSKVTNMDSMFAYTGRNATNWSISGLENWNTSNVTSMKSMFFWNGNYSSRSLDLSSWNVDNVIDHSGFGDGTPIIPPNWVN